MKQTAQRHATYNNLHRVFLFPNTLNNKLQPKTVFNELKPTNNYKKHLKQFQSQKNDRQLEKTRTGQAKKNLEQPKTSYTEKSPTGHKQTKSRYQNLWN